MNKIYNFDDMEKLSQKIKKIKKEEYLRKILEIIKFYNPSINITENSYGSYLKFNDLVNDTFIQLDKYVNKCFENEKNNKLSSEFNFINDNSNDNTFNNQFKFSNKEKTIIKKRLYDTALKKNNELTDSINNTDTTNTINTDNINTDNINTNISNNTKKDNTFKIFYKKK
jgi:hypothetical protein